MMSIIQLKFKILLRLKNRPFFLLEETEIKRNHKLKIHKCKIMQKNKINAIIF